jgi:hypothetical protein
MRMASYQETLKRVQPIVPLLFTGLERGLAASAQVHDRQQLNRSTDQHYFSHTVRRHAVEYLMGHGLLVTDDSGQRSRLGMSGLQVNHNGVCLWIFRGKDEVPLPGHSHRKQDFYNQVPSLDGWDNILLLWHDVDGVLAEPMFLVRPVAGDHLRRNLRVEWDGPLRRDIALMRAADLDLLRPSYRWSAFGGADTA